MLGSLLRSSVTSVVFPAPDGATTTKRFPACFAPRASRLVPRASLNVLHLFTHLLDEHLQLHRDARDLVGDRLGAERVRLAVELLAEEIQALAARPALVEHAAEFGDVRHQPR